jgi:hypothetical protein
MDTPVVVVETKYYEDLINSVIAYEKQALDEAATVAMFQGLVDTGLLWSIEPQQRYRAAASALVSAGKVQMSQTTGWNPDPDLSGMNADVR